INRVRGMLYEVRIWNIARSQSEIQANMNHRLTGSEAYLLAYWAFDEGVGTTALDSTGHGLNGALVNGPTWVNSTAALSGIYNWTEWSEIPTNMTTDVTPNCTVYQGR